MNRRRFHLSQIVLAFATFHGSIWECRITRQREPSMPDGAILPILDHELADDELQWMKSVYGFGEGVRRGWSRN